MQASIKKVAHTIGYLQLIDFIGILVMLTEQLFLSFRIVYNIEHIHAVSLLLSNPPFFAVLSQN